MIDFFIEQMYSVIHADLLYNFISCLYDLRVGQEIRFFAKQEAGYTEDIRLL